jgi:hypothetical protein
MNWTATSGLALLLVSMGILAWVVPHLWDQGSGQERPASSEASPLEAKIRERLRRRQLRTRQMGFAGGAALLLGSIFLILQSRDPVPPPQAVRWVAPSAWSGSSASGSSVIIVAPPASPPVSEVPVWRPSFIIPAVVFAALIVTGVFLIISRSLLARLSGASLLFAATMTSQFHLIKELKFAPEFTLGSSSLTADQIRDIVDARIAAMKADLIKEVETKIEFLIGKLDIKGVVDSRIAVMKVNLINELKAELKSLVDKIEINIDKVALEAKFDTYLRQIGTLGPERLGDFTGFEPGRSEFAANMRTSIANVCDRWLRRTDYQDAFLLVIGATDRVPLGPAARLRYESNFGLARARAEEIKSRIMECGVPATKILAIVSGPQTTPVRTSQAVPESGYPRDRMVEVWAIWHLRDRR